MKSEPLVKAPSMLLLAMEGRAWAEFGALIAAKPFLKRAPKGDGHPVLVLPGLAASDMSTKPLRSYLKKQGYTPYAWGLGRNMGLRPGILEGMLDRIDSIHAAHGKPVSLIGWSLGGIFARELAKLRPHMVRQVITLGSPHSGDPKASHAWRFYEFAAGHSVEEPPIETKLHEAPPVPTTSVYSKTDGIVAWQNCHQASEGRKEQQVENIVVEGSHCGLGVNPTVLYVIAERLAQAEGTWAPFENTGSRRLFFKTPAPELGLAV